jgi:hypothetical protein
MMRIQRLLAILILLGLVLPGCTQKAAVTTGKLQFNVAYPAAWIDAPLDNSQLPLAPYEVVIHLANPEGLTAGEVSVNGLVVATIPVDQAGMTLATIKYRWSPDKPGKYEIQTRAQSQSGSWGPPAISHVTIVTQITETPTFTVIPELTISPSITPTFTDTITPSPSPSMTPTLTPTTGEMVFVPSVSENSIKVGSCSPNQTTIQVQITPNDAIKYVFLFVHLKDQSSDETTAWNDGYAMQSTSTPGVYRFTLKTASLEDNRKFSSAYLWYQFVATDKKNTNIGRSKVMGDVVVSRCGSNPVIELPPITLPTGIKLFTPTSMVK